MRIATFTNDGHPEAAIRHNETYIPLSRINVELETDWLVSLKPLLDSGRFGDLTHWYTENTGRLDQVEGIPVEEAAVGPLYRDPAKIWGIGLNYADHAGDLDENVPEGLPGSFLKPATTLIGPGDEVQIPVMSERTTGEGELGIIFGQTCKDVPQQKWQDVVAGFTTIIDMTAEDILRRNPRYLTNGTMENRPQRCEHHIALSVIDVEAIDNACRVVLVVNLSHLSPVKPTLQ